MTDFNVSENYIVKRFEFNFKICYEFNYTRNLVVIIQFLVYVTTSYI